MSKIITSRLQIVPFGEEYLTPHYVTWLNDPEVVKYSEQRFKKHTLETCREYWQSFQDTSNYFWAIVSPDPELGYIGTMTAYVDGKNKSADIGILIGEKRAWGKGYGLEVWQEVCTWLFDNAGIENVTVGTDAKNIAMRKIIEKSGMKITGERDGKIYAEQTRV